MLVVNELFKISLAPSQEDLRINFQAKAHS